MSNEQLPLNAEPRAAETGRYHLSRKLLKAFGSRLVDSGIRSIRQIFALACAACLLSVFGFQNAHAQINVDSTSSAMANTNNLTWSHTIGSGSNRILIISVSNRDGNKTVTSVTYGGTALTQIGFQNGPGNQNRTSLWKLLAPPTGTASIVVTLSGSVNVVGGAVSFDNVDQTTPHGTFVSANGTSTTASVNVTSAAGEVVIDTATANGDAVSLTAGAGQTAQWNTGTGTAGGNVRGGGSTEGGAPAVTMSWTLGASKPWSIGAVSLKPVLVPDITLTKSVNPAGVQPPGTDLTYAVDFSNGGGVAGSSFLITDPIPANTDFKVGSVTSSLGKD